jgi:hypothetical protein
MIMAEGAKSGNERAGGTPLGVFLNVRILRVLSGSVYILGTKADFP